ncbi:MAG: fibronectin type III domain-containing protein [Planctomycetota bacterium]
MFRTKLLIIIAAVLFIGYVITLNCSGCGGGGGSSGSSDGNPTGTAPSAPTGVTATAGDKEIIINWNSVTSATSYNIYWSTTLGVNKTSGTKINNATRPYTHTGLTNETTYYYVVTAANSDGESSVSSEVNATPSVTLLPAPTGITATAGDKKITINWDIVTSATSYNIYWATASGVNKTSGTKITSATRPYTHTGRTNGTPYYYVVTSENIDSESNESSEISATPRSPWTISAIDTTGNVGDYTSITVDANTKVHISYYDITNQKLKYATNLSDSWVMTPVADAPTTAYGTSIGMDTNGNIHIAYEGTGGDLMYATNSSGSWVPTIVEGGAWSSDVSLALDSNNNVHISYFTAVGFDLKYATNSGGPWTTFIIVNGGALGPLPGYSTSIGIDSSNNVHISYYDDSSPDSIKYITNASGSWEITPITTIGFAAGWETSLVVDSSDDVHISYYDWNDDAVKYATNSSGTWQTYTVDDTSGNVWDAAITVDSNKYVHLSYSSASGFMYATNASGSWVISNVDASWTGGGSSIAVDSGGGVHISYKDGYNDDLKYATK